MASKEKTAEPVEVHRKGINMTVSSNDLDNYLKRGYSEGRATGTGERPQRDDGLGDDETDTVTPTKNAPAKATGVTTTTGAKTPSK